RRLKVALSRVEELLFAFLCGSAIISLLVFLLCVVHQARSWVFAVVGVAVVGAATIQGGSRASVPGPRPRAVVFLLLAIPFLIYFFNALAPEVSPDGSGYHLGNVLRLWHNRGFVWEYHSIYSSLSQGLEML